MIYMEIKLKIYHKEENDITHNSFKRGEENFNELIGEVNEGEDYPKNERNNYNLYVPYSLLEKKQKKIVSYYLYMEEAGQ